MFQKHFSIEKTIADFGSFVLKASFCSFVFLYPVFMNSVLLIGSECFTASVAAQVRGLDVLTSTAITTVSGAIALMEKSIPDVVIVQASRLIEGSILKTFSQEQHGIYFIVLEHSSRASLAHPLDPSQPPSSEQDVFEPDLDLLELSQGPSQGVIEGLSERYIEKKIIALEAGADAYILLMPVSHQYRATSLAACETARHNGNGNGASVSVVSTLDPEAADFVIPIPFRKSQQRLIQAYIQIGLNRAQRYRDLSRINDWLSAVALVDALTQLSNRRSFDMELPRQIKVARTKDTPLSLMVVDIDLFKSVNDRYGHLVGDDVLKLLAKRLLANMRFYDAPFRYGGEEFVITLNNTDVTEGMAIAQRLRHSINQEPFKVIQSVDDITQLPLTVSIGLTELKESDDPKGRSFLHRADQHLLEAKASGRNRVISDQNCL